MAVKNFHLSEEEVQRGMRNSIWDGVLAGPIYNLIVTSGPIFTGLALLLGASHFQIGLFAAVGPLLSGICFLSARLMEQGVRRSRHYLLTAALQRASFLVLLAFPFLSGVLAPESMPWLLLGVLFFATIFHYCQLTAWVSWMADMIPVERRGRFFSRRNMIAGGSWMLLFYLTSLYLDQHKALADYAHVYAFFAISSLVALHFAAQQPDPPLPQNEERQSFKELWREASKDRSFRNFLYYNLSWGLASNLAMPFYSVYMIQSLGLDISQITALTVFGTLLSLISTPWWGHVLDQVGERATMLFAMLGTCILGCLWPFVNAGNLHWLLAIILIASAFFQTGQMQAAFNMHLGVLPEKNKTSYIALSQTLTNSIVGLSPILGGWTAHTLKIHEIPGLPFDPLMLVIIVSAILRFFPIFFVRSIVTRHPHGVAYLVQEYVLVNPFKVMATITQDLLGGGREGKGK